MKLEGVTWLPQLHLVFSAHVHTRLLYNNGRITHSSDASNGHLKVSLVLKIYRVAPVTADRKSPPLNP